MYAFGNPTLAPQDVHKSMLLINLLVSVLLKGEYIGNAWMDIIMVFAWSAELFVPEDFSQASVGMGDA